MELVAAIGAILAASPFHGEGYRKIRLAVAVLQASTPTAVSSALWALDFDARPSLVSAAVVLSTVVSVVTLPVLLAVL